MTETLTATPQPAIARRRFSADEFEQMIEAGILAEQERIELIDGEIVQMSPIGGAHVETVARVNRLLSRQIGDRALVSVQGSMRLSDYGEPQPDFVVMQDRKYHRAVPTVADVFLVMEVADSSLAYDRRIKLPLFAAAGIAEAWLIDINAGAIERHTEPRDGQYRHSVTSGRGESLPSTVLAQLIISVDGAFG